MIGWLPCRLRPPEWQQSRTTVRFEPAPFHSLWTGISLLGRAISIQKSEGQITAELSEASSIQAP